MGRWLLSFSRSDFRDPKGAGGKTKDAEEFAKRQLSRVWRLYRGRRFMRVSRMCLHSGSASRRRMWRRLRRAWVDWKGLPDCRPTSRHIYRCASGEVHFVHLSSIRLKKSDSSIEALQTEDAAMVHWAYSSRINHAYPRDYERKTRSQKTEQSGISG